MLLNKNILVSCLDLDDLAPATDFIVSKRDQAVKLRMSDSGPAAEKPRTVPSMFYQTVQRVPNHPALGKIHSPTGHREWSCLLT